MASLTLPCGAVITLVQGSIVDQKVDVIVNSTELNLDLVSAAALSKVILEAAGPELQNECNSKYPDGFKAGQVAVTEAHNLSNKYIYHVYCPAFRKNGLQRIEQNVTSCLCQADKDGHHSIAFPALGCGAGSYPPDQAAQTILSSMRMYFSDDQSNLKIVNIVLRHEDQEIIHAFETAFCPRMASKSGIRRPAKIGTDTEPSPAKRAKTTAATPGVPVLMHTAETSKVKSKNIIELTLDGGQTVAVFSGSITDHKADVVVNTTNLTLKPENASSACDAIFKKAGPKLTEECGQLFPNGMKEGDVAVTGGHEMDCKAIYHINCPPWDAGKSLDTLLTTVLKCLERACTGRHDTIVFPAIGTGGLSYPIEQVAETMLSSVHSFYRDGSRKNPKHVQILLFYQDNYAIKVFTEVFEKAKTVGVNITGQTTTLIDTRAGLPKNWFPTEVVGIYEVDKNSEEYKEVETKFVSSSPGGCIAAKLIFRVQNIDLFKQYSLYKQRVEKRCKDTERMLWHGTSKDAIEKIYKGGFNRSYCGKNASNYGKGVYFALNRSYSTHGAYSVPDADGTRCMYYAKVLVGQPALGKQGMLVPPPLNSDPDVTHDSLVNNMTKPEIFVIFHDCQAYPEYLIYF